MRSYFQMSEPEKARYRAMVVQAVQKQWENAVIYQEYEGSYEKWLHIYLDRLEAKENYEQLQAFIDYHTTNDHTRKR